MSAVTDAYNQRQDKSQSLADFRQTYQEPTAPQVQPAQVQPAPAGFQRDQAKENATLSKLGISNIQSMQMADNPAFKKQLLDMTYGASASQIPEYQKLQQSQEEREGLGQQLGDIRQNAPNAMLALEDALRTKNDVGAQPMGESELYKKAGLQGIEVLGQSMNEQSRLMQDRYGSFINALSRAGDYQTNQYRALGDQYKTLTDAYETKRGEMNSMLDGIQQYNDRIRMAEEEMRLQQEGEEWKRQFGPDAKEKAEMHEKGYTHVNGEYVPNESFDAVFSTLGNKSDRDYGQCGYMANRMTVGSGGDAQWVGDTWQSKIGKVTHYDSPTAGDKLVTPYGTAEIGHVGTVLEFDPITRDVTVVEWNRQGDQQREVNTYNIDELSRQYTNTQKGGKADWGFIKADLKPEYAQKLQGLSGDSVPDGGDNMYQSFIKEAESIGLSGDKATQFADDRVKESYKGLTEAQGKAYKAYVMANHESEQYKGIIAGVDPEEMADAINVISLKIKDYETPMTAEIVNRYIDNPKIRQAIMSELRWTASVLREESGAAISVQEYLSKGMAFFPRAGDDEVSLQQKERGRELETQGLYGKMGPSGQRQYRDFMADFETSQKDGQPQELSITPERIDEVRTMMQSPAPHQIAEIDEAKSDLQSGEQLVLRDDGTGQLKFTAITADELLPTDIKL